MLYSFFLNGNDVEEMDVKNYEMKTADNTKFNLLDHNMEQNGDGCA
jgi:hypothetical protein